MILKEQPNEGFGSRAARMVPLFLRSLESAQLAKTNVGGL